MKDLRSSELPRLMTTAEVASVLRVDPSTLSRWRSSGLGPRVTWVIVFVTRYQRDDVVEWLRRADA
jgi:helix-turn-helix protein